MKNITIAALLLASAAPVMAQDQTLTSGSASGAEANSGSISGASSDGNQQGQAQTANNAGIGTSRNDLESTSNSAAFSGSESHSGAISDQSQGQTQGQSTSQTNQQGQMATNNQGVSVTNEFNSVPLRRTYVGTNAAVPLAASSSFSTDYCGGTASGGASAAPIGISVGVAKPVFDESCQYLRRSEKFGMAAANYWNMQQPEMALRLQSLMVWSICMADTRNDAPTPTEQACQQMLGSLPSEPPPVAQAQPPVQPEYVAPNADVAPEPEYNPDILRTPRGSIDGDLAPVPESQPASPLAMVGPH